jgi:hypothetical protein
MMRGLGVIRAFAINSNNQPSVSNKQLGIAGTASVIAHLHPVVTKVFHSQQRRVGELLESHIADTPELHDIHDESNYKDTPEGNITNRINTASMLLEGLADVLIKWVEVFAPNNDVAVSFLEDLKPHLATMATALRTSTARENKDVDIRESDGSAIANVIRSYLQESGDETSTVRQG